MSGLPLVPIQSGDNQGEGDRNHSSEGEILSRVVRDVTCEEVTFEHRPEGVEKEIEGVSGEKRSPDSEDGVCKGPGAGELGPL